MFSDAFLSKINSKKWPDILDDTLDNNMNIMHSVDADIDGFLSIHKKRCNVSEAYTRKRTNTAMSRRVRCRGVLVRGPFIKSICGRQGNLTG